jgi:cell shape-determining protein MreC
MILAAVLSLLPASWTRWKRGIVQALGLPQWALSTAARDVRRGDDGGAGISAHEARRLQGENEELQRLVAGQQAWLDGLEQRYEEVTGLRKQLSDSRTGILIAPVLSYDASPRRDTLLIGRGAADEVREGLWVAAGVPAAQRNTGETGRQLLLRQWLVGRVTEVWPRESRVVLASDPKFGQPQAGEAVCLARLLPDGRWQPTAPKFILSGRGRERMVINQADADYPSQGYDVVLVPPSTVLPVMLSIGKIVSSTQSRESALHYDLEVRPLADPYALRHVYVILPGQ